MVAVCFLEALGLVAIGVLAHGISQPRIVFLRLRLLICSVLTNADPSAGHAIRINSKSLFIGEQRPQSGHTLGSVTMSRATYGCIEGRCGRYLNTGII